MKPLIGHCIGCGRKDALYHAHRDEYLCPRCGNLYETGELAEPHLWQILDPLIEAWRQHWIERGVSMQFLKEVLDGYTETDRSRMSLQHGYEVPAPDFATLAAAWGLDE
jgi:recombinational DNA repair protein (RecF pathway)